MTELDTDITEQVTTILPTPVAGGYRQNGYDMRLAALLAQLCGITAQELVERTQEVRHASAD